MPRAHRPSPLRRPRLLRGWRRVAALAAVAVLTGIAVIGFVAHRPSTVTAKAPEESHTPPPEPGRQVVPPPREPAPVQTTESTPPSVEELDASLAAGMRSSARAAGMAPEALIPDEGLRRRARQAGDLGSPEAQALLEAYRQSAERVAAELNGEPPEATAP